MFKKSLASIVSAAVLVAGPGHLTLDAAAQTLTRGPVTGVSVTPTIGNGLNSPVPGVSSFNMPSLTPGALLAPSLTVAPKPVVPAVASPVSLAPVPASLAAKAMPAAAKGSPLAVIESRDAKVGVAEKGAALNALFENSAVAGPEALEVLGQAAASDSPLANRSDLSRAEASSAKSPASIARASMAKASAAGELAIVTLIKRAWNAVLGMLGIGVKKMETPEVMAQRIIDQLNAAKPVYNRKVQEASTLVEKLKLQAEGDAAKVAELEQGITALLSDSDPANDVLASGMINQQKTLNGSIAATNEQIVLAEATLTSIKEERARFFSEREETIAKIQAGLTKSAAADIQKQIAELKGGFQVGDLKDNMDRFEDAVNDKVADAKGTVDSVESNPDQILKKAKDSLKSQEIKDELARRKAAIEQARKDKGQAGGGVAISALKAVGIAVNVVMAVWAGLNTGWIAMLLGAGAVMGVVMPLGSIGGIALGVFAEKVMKTSGAKTAGMAILGAVIGFGLGLVAVGFGGYVGYAVASQTAAIALGATALVTSLLDVAFKFIFKKDKPASDKPAAGGLILELGIGAAVIAILAAVSAPFRSLLARAWNATLGIFGLGVKKLETPEVMAQRIIDQLNAQKPVYNRKVQEASTLVEKLRLQIEKQTAQSADLDRSVTALLSDSDPLNDVMAESLLNQKKTVDASTAMTQEQLTISEKTLVSIKEERASFFSEREEMLAKIQAGLTKAKSAEIQKQIAELKGGFQVGDLKDNMDRFEDAVNDKVADAKGTVDSVESNPDQILKKAKDSLKNQEVQDEIAKRKAAIEAARKAKGAAGGLAVETLAMGTLYTILAGMLAFIFPLALREFTPFPAMARLKPVYGILLALPGVASVKIRRVVTSVYSAEFGVRVTLTDGADMAAAAEALRPWETKLGLPIEIVDGQSTKLLWQVGPKAQAGGDVSQSKALGHFAKVVGVGFALISPWISAAVYSVLGLFAIAMAPEQGRWLGRQLAVIGLGTLVIGGAASLAVSKLGLAMGAFGVGVSFLVPAGIALAVGVIATIRANKKDAGTIAAAAATPAGSSVTPAPVAAPVEASAPAASSPKASFSIKPLLDLIARAWNALLGVLGMGVKKMETPEVMAQRLIDQLNAAKPVYNNKVREASTLVEKLRQQIAAEQAKIADFDKTITALLSDNDPANDIQAAGLLNSQKTLEASVAASKDQLAAGERALENIKEERSRFFSEREETLAKIQAGLTKVKSAEIQKQIAELKGGFQIGDLKDNMDRFDDAVNDKVADAKGTVDSVESNPDQVLKKAKDSLRTQEIADELAKRKAAIEAAKKAKGDAAGKKDESAVNPKNWLYLKIGAALVGFLAALALVPEALIPQALSQIGGALFMSWIFGKSDKKLDAIAFSVAIAAMIAVPLPAPAAMVGTARGAVGTAYFLFLLFA